MFPLPGLYERPSSWGEREPIVDILAYTLMPNHFHLILRETQEGGTSLFMKRLGQSMTNYSNEKYQEQGSLFQGAYRSRTIQDDNYLKYVSAYVMVKNSFELYPNGGIKAARSDFESVWGWSVKYPFSSLKYYATTEPPSPAVATDILKQIFDPIYFKEFSRDVIVGGKWKTNLNDLE